MPILRRRFFLEGQVYYNGDNEKGLKTMSDQTHPHENIGNDGYSDSGQRKSHHSLKVKENLTSRLNRIEGQIRGVKGMIEKDAYCDDVLNQIAAIQSALNSVGKILLEGHMKSCVVERLEEGDKEVIDELLKTIGKLMK
jgi:DNA-binding FrmR family transcriptional regulator